MSMLYPGALPEVVCVNGEEYDIRSQFYIALEITRILHDAEMDMEAGDRMIRMMLALTLFYTERVPESTEHAMQAMQEFIERGSWSNGYTSTHEETERALDWEMDAPFIWASMKQAYPLWDWSQAHWWEFKAAFDSLPVTSKIKEIMQIRTREVDSRMDKDSADSLQELKKFYRLERKREPKRKVVDIEAELKAKAEVR